MLSIPLMGFLTHRRLCIDLEVAKFLSIPLMGFIEVLRKGIEISGSQTFNSINGILCNYTRYIHSIIL